MNFSEIEKALLDRLSTLSPAQRASALDEACANGTELPSGRMRILAALAGDEAPQNEPASVSDQSAVRAFEFALGSKADETSGAWIGPYKLQQKIGEGGFGVVWLAEQKVPIRRRVAVKIIKIGMDTEEVIARFEAERQALALMDHPNIARVLDAGATDTGRPFFVMELVRGVAITRYCDENRLSPDERLKLFILVCQAVQHAHQKGVIHRDLKPSNILVTVHDGVPAPKIIDFGIAKATSARLTEKTLFTQFHAFIGTPAYTSPEQLEMSGLDVDTRSDIYSLGVLLYELLAGQPPFDPSALQKSGLEEMRRTIREVDPMRPSRRLSTLSNELRTTVAAQRSTDPARLSVLLRGDLDWIVMHCLEKDRTRRYETANSLAADVRNYLNNETVAARPASAAYRFRKFVQRHRLPFLAGSSAALALIAGLVVASVSLVRERAALRREASLRREADIQAAQARTSAAKSAEFALFMKAMLSGVAPSVALGRDTVMLREILDGTTRRLDAGLRNQPEVVADLSETLGAVYSDLGQYTSAEPLLREAVAMHRAVAGRESVETAMSLHRLGAVLRLLKKMGEAETTLQEALAIRTKILGRENPAVADTLYELAFVISGQRDLPAQRVLLEEALAIRRRAFGDEHPAVAQALAGLGQRAQSDLDHENGAKFHAQALAMRRRLLGSEHPDVAASLDALGYSYAHELERKSEAAAAYLEAFTIRRKVLGDLHPQMVVSLLRFTGQKPARDVDAETLAVVRGFVANQRKGLPHGSSLLAPSLLALASLEDVPDRHPEEARALVREARSILEEARSSGVPANAEIIEAMWFFGWSKFVGNVPVEGRAMSEASVSLAQSSVSINQRELFFATHTLAWIERSTGRNVEAAKQFEAVLALSRALSKEPNVISNLDLAALGACYGATNRVAEAHRLLEAALLSHEANSSGGRSPSAISLVRGEFGRTLLQESRFAEAEAVLRRTLLGYDAGDLRPLGLRIAPRQRVMSGLGQALAGQGKFAEAEALLVPAFHELQGNETRVAGDRSGMVREALEAVIALYGAWGKSEQVSAWSARRGERSSVQP